LRDALEEAVRDALARRGTVMLQAAGRRRLWVAVHVSVEGEVQIGTPPPTRTRFRFADHDAEAALRKLGFVFVFDTWEAPIGAGASVAAQAAELMETVLVDVHGAEREAGVERVLQQHGTVQGAATVAPDAPHDAHLRAAVAALLTARRGRARFDAGRPARARAWAFTGDDALRIEDIEPKDGFVVKLPLEAGVEQQAAELLGSVLDRAGRRPGDPLYVALMDVEG
jgi:hypothetical protein